MIASNLIGMVGREVTRAKVQRTGCRDFYQANVQAHREIRENSTSPRAHALHAVEDNMNTRDTQQNETWQERQKWRGSIRRQMQKVVERTHKGQSTTHLYPANIGEVGPRSKGSKGVVWWWGENDLSLVSNQGSFGNILC